jgi:hypothetical protein
MFLPSISENHVSYHGHANQYAPIVHEIVHVTPPVVCSITFAGKRYSIDVICVQDTAPHENVINAQVAVREMVASLY